MTSPRVGGRCQRLLHPNDGSQIVRVVSVMSVMRTLCRKDYPLSREGFPSRRQGGGVDVRGRRSVVPEVVRGVTESTVSIAFIVVVQAVLALLIGYVNVKERLVENGDWER